MSTSIGIFSGTFDPVHKGHITFALEAMRQSGLGDVYFLPEQRPRHKQGVTHYAHRIAMLRLALQPYKHMHVLELPDRQLSVLRTLPRLQQLFDAHIHLLIGSDTLQSMAENSWPNQNQLLKKVSLVVGLRIGQSKDEAKSLIQKLPKSARVSLIQADNHHAASSDIRYALIKGNTHDAHLSSLSAYINRNWLYCAVVSDASV